MTVLYFVLGIILGIIALLCLLLFLRARVYVIWCNEFFVRVGVGVLSKETRLSDFAAEKGGEKTEKKPEKTKKRKEKAPKQKVKLTLSQQIEMLKEMLAEAYNRFGKKLRIEKYVLKVSVATPDAAQTAVVYGAVSAAMANALFAAERLNRKRRARLYSECKPDFLTEQTDVYVDVGLSIMLWNAVLTGLKLWLINRKVKKKAKKEQKNEGHTS